MKADRAARERLRKMEQKITTKKRLSYQQLFELLTRANELIQVKERYIRELEMRLGLPQPKPRGLILPPKLITPE